MRANDTNNTNVEYKKAANKIKFEIMGEVIAEKGRSVAEIENDVRRVRDELEEMERNDLVEGRPPLEKRLAELTEELDRARAEESSEYDDVT